MKKNECNLVIHMTKHRITKVSVINENNTQTVVSTPVVHGQLFTVPTIFHLVDIIVRVRNKTRRIML